MKILFITPEWPYPLDQGGRIRMFHLLQQLAHHHEVHLISVLFQPVSPAEYAPLGLLCHSIQTILYPNSPWRAAGRVAKSLLLRRPYIISKYLAPALPGLVRQTIEQVKPDCLFVNVHYLAACGTGVGVPTLVDFHDIASVLYARFAQNPRWGLKKVHGHLQLPLLTRFEALLPAQLRACTTVSEEDAAHLRRLSGGSNIFVLPSGVDEVYFQPQPVEVADCDLIYVGSMDYYPNVDGVLFLVQEVLPLIWQKRPNTTLSIVGRNPTKTVQQLAQDKRISVTGWVADVRPYLQRARLVLIPLRIGGGTRLKVLEAAAMGKTIVGTSIGLEGLGLENGRHAIFADTPERLAQATLHLLHSPEYRQQLGTAARSWVVERFSWQAVGRRLEEILGRLEIGD